MYDRFTDRARKVFQLANQEALRLHHPYIGTEHILLGLVKEGSGVAANVLGTLRLDLVDIRREAERLIIAGPHTVTLGKLPQTPRAKRVIEYAIDEAKALKHDYVGTEHLLLGLLRENEGVAAQILFNLGVNLQRARAEVMSLLGVGVPMCGIVVPSWQQQSDANSQPPAFVPQQPERFPFPPPFQPENPAGGLVKPLMLLLLMSLIVNVILAAFLWQLHFAAR